MKNLQGILVFILGGVVVCLSLWAVGRVVTGIKKNLAESKPQTVDSSQIIDDQRRRAQDTLERQRELIRDQRQRLRDLQRR